MKILYIIGAFITVAIAASAATLLIVSQDIKEQQIVEDRLNPTTFSDSGYVDNTVDVVGGLPEVDDYIDNLVKSTKQLKTKTYSDGKYIISVTLPEGYDVIENKFSKSISFSIKNDNQDLTLDLVDYCLFEYCFMDVEEIVNLPGMKWNYIGIRGYYEGGEDGLPNVIPNRYVYSYEITAKDVAYVSSSQKLHTTSNKELFNIFSSIRIENNRGN